MTSILKSFSLPKSSTSQNQMHFIKGNLYLITHNEAKMTDFFILLLLHALKKHESIKLQISRGLFIFNNYNRSKKSHWLITQTAVKL